MVRCYDYCNLLWPSSGHGCAAVDPGINILLLPPAVLHNKSDKFTTGQSTVWDRNNETDKGSFKLQTWIRNDAMVNSAFFLMASLTLLAIKASQHDAYLIWALGFLEIVYLSEPKLSQAKGKEKDRELLQYSAVVKSWGHGHLPHSPWSWTERCRLPWSRHRPSGCLEGRCDPKHHLTLETSYPGMEILSYVHVLTKRQGKGTWALTQKSCQGIWRLVSKESLCEGPLFQTNRELSQPYACIPRTPEHLQERINQKTLSQILPTIFILQLKRNIPWTTMTSNCVLFRKTCNRLSYRTSSVMKLKGLLKPIHATK